MSKTISKGTLNLKFMQNAQRANQLQEVELDRAEVQDDGKWEVSQAVRDAWGLGKDTVSQLSEVHEASYLPFLFDKSDETDDVSTTSRKTHGRRVFNKDGKEVLQTSSSEPAFLPPSSAAEPPPAPTDRKPVHRPTSISGSRTSSQQSKTKDSKTARQAIFESGGVGVDLRTQAREAAPTEFLKPAGVDDPKDTKPVLPESPASAPHNLTSGAREQKVKREREAPVNDSGEARAKPKKRKKKETE
ncbi:unnamed protein product [Cyclocybe aegerita]|uniref:Uncharacterized protein n=1 Tax=Cyclocybe aegerita TaxID=1973307 RepID=A0A8S0W4F0_CYCAE|nr:unnamed protein product [Cyclocybe aegerita]